VRKEPKAKPKPTRTLVKEDFSLDAKDLAARIEQVAASLGGGMLGRIREAKLFDSDVTVSFQQWWDAAPPESRLVALVSKRNLTTITSQEAGKLAGLQCPFRGSLDFLVSQKTKSS
jgi:hypothetical protein